MSEESVFEAARIISDPADRVRFLDRACAGQPELRRDVDALLAAAQDDNPLDRRPADLAATGTYISDDGPPAAAVGDRIGPYRLMEQIGEGGFGLVFVAEQTEPVRRKVALKVLKPGMDTKQVVARFEAERQALALMDHPNIAKVLDAGTTASGRPFFVMELVRGVPITEFCDAHKLPPRDRLHLFVQVCQAVQHAHQKGVIHRDLKPSNVLVTVVDGAPVPKVIDFGVAKAVGQSLTDKTVYTGFAQLIGTPLYMSPEQAQMSGVDVDTRSDVYSLGVLLYELLTGTTPFDRRRFHQAAFDEIRRIVREEEPPRPSTRLTSLGETLTAVSANRQTDPGKLAGLIRGELDWIVMRCLEKDRNRRYETATGLAKDVQRYLTGDAVEACPPTLGYRLRKAYRRNRGPVAAGGVVMLALVLGVAGTTWQAVRADAARQAEADARAKAVAERDDKERARAEAVEAKRRADEERADAEAVKTFVTADLLGMTNQWGAAGDPDERGPNVTVRALLDRAARRAGEQFADRPLVEAGVRSAIGGSYRAIGLLREALRQHERALELYRRHRGPDAPETLAALVAVAVQYKWDLNEPARAEPLIREAVDGYRRTQGPDGRETLGAVAQLADVLWITGRVAEAKAMKTEAYERSVRALGPDDPTTSILRNAEVLILAEGGDYPAAQRLGVEGLARARRALGDAHPATHYAAQKLLEVYLDSGRPDLAEPVAAEFVGIARRRFGEWARDTTLADLGLLARVYQRRGRDAEAVPLLEQLRTGYLRADGPTAASTLSTAVNLAALYVRLGRTADGLAVIEKVDPHPLDSPWLYNAACVYALAAGRAADTGEADRHARRAVALLREATAKGHRDPVFTVNDPDFDAVLDRPDFRAALAEVGAKAPAAYPDALAILGAKLLHRGAFAAAEPVLRECLALRETAVPDAWNTFNTRSQLGGALLGLGKTTEAAPLLLRGYEGMKAREKAIPPQGRSRLPEAADRLAEFYTATNRPADAARWRAERAQYPPPVEPGPTPREAK